MQYIESLEKVYQNDERMMILIGPAKKKMAFFRSVYW